MHGNLVMVQCLHVHVLVSQFFSAISLFGSCHHITTLVINPRDDKVRHVACDSDFGVCD